MRCVFSYPGVMEHAQHAALALHEVDALDAYVASYVFRDTPTQAALLRALPGGLGERLGRQLRRRTMPNLPTELVHGHGGWEIVRTLADKAMHDPILTDKLWDFAAHRFDDMVARRYVPRSEAVVAVEYTALASFEQAKRLGRARILHLPSLDSRAFERLQAAERATWPELRKETDVYFDGMFDRRYARRRAEIQLADVIIANSSLTKRSHVAAGASAEKVFVVPLAAPPPVAQPSILPLNRPLMVIWAGAFTLGKGAHYLLEAWRGLRAGGAAQLEVYGHLGLPARLLEDLPHGVTFHGSVPRSQVLEVFEQADILVFPTLSDGFGAAATEALSRGVPVIISDQAGAADLIVHGENGLVIPAADAGAIAEALQWCLDNRTSLRDMRTAALATARSRQWPDYRRDVVAAMRRGLAAAGYAPRFGDD
ncbi:MAG: hypothetical protein JWL79_3888 [Frankiales bacterium]|nr:hypothetical protein [Frankiales bacterium]